MAKIMDFQNKFCLCCIINVITITDLWPMGQILENKVFYTLHIITPIDIILLFRMMIECFSVHDFLLFGNRQPLVKGRSQDKDHMTTPAHLCTQLKIWFSW